MRCNIYKDKLESAELFGKPVLFTDLPIERESVPDDWFCYDLAASDRNPVKPATPWPARSKTASICMGSCWIWRASARKITSLVPRTLENMFYAPLLLKKKRGSSIP